MKLSRLKKRAKKRGAKDSIPKRLGSTFENGPDKNPLINLAYYGGILFVIVLGFIFTVTVIPITEALSRLKKVVTAPFRRGNTPPDDNGAS
jgi:hypothetical protein